MRLLGILSLGILLGLLFGESESLAKQLPTDHDLGRKLTTAGPLGFADLKLDFLAGALRPFNDLAFVIGFRINNDFQVKIELNQFIDHKFLATQIALIQVHGAYQRFQGVAQNYFLQLRVAMIVLHDRCYPDFAREVVE